jgi:hypothetical protein
LPTLYPSSWAADLLDDKFCKDKDRTVVMCAMWSLWNARNDKNHGKSPIDPKLAIDWALDASSLLVVCKEEATVARPAKWIPPSDGVVKVNCDGGFCAEDKSGSTGVVLRNSVAFSRVLTDKRRIPLRSASVRTPHLFHHGIPKVLVNPRSKGITSVQSTFTH